MGGAVFPPCHLTWGQTMVEVMKIMVTSFKRSQAYSAALSARDPAAGHRQPMPWWRPLDTHGQVWVSLLWGHFFLMDPGAHKVLFVPCKSLFLVLCKFWWLYGGVNGDCLQEGLYHTGLLHPESLPLRQSTADPNLHRRHSNTVLSQSLWDLWVLVHTRYVWALWTSLPDLEIGSKCDFTIPTILLYPFECRVPKNSKERFKKKKKRPSSVINAKK